MKSRGSTLSTRRSAFTIGSLVVLLFLGAGCGWLVKEPEVRLTGARFEAGDSLWLSVVVRNPNRFGIRVSEVEYRVSLAGVAVGGGRVGQELALGGRADVPVELPLRPSRAGLLAALPGLASDSIACRVDGSYRLVTPLGRLRRTFRLERGVALRRRLEEALRPILAATPGERQ
jgi:hypothetical protein